MTRIKALINKVFVPDTVERLARTLIQSSIPAAIAYFAGGIDLWYGVGLPISTAVLTAVHASLRPAKNV
jgi:hypothetical protein